MTASDAPSRNSYVTATGEAGPVAGGTCVSCEQPLPDGRAGRRYCSDRCRQAGWRRRHHPAQAARALPARQSRRDGTVYACDDCGVRYLGQQWCPDCTRPARRLGTGGACGHCDELLTINELLNNSLQP